MARVEKADRGVAARLDELEQRIFLLKIEYEKYFSGIERIEPVRDREEVRRMLRDLMEEQLKSSAQRFRFQSLKSRFQSFELYWTRNLVMIERGIHPKMKFRADIKDKKVAAEPALSAEQQEVLRQRQEQMEREERAYRVVYDKYMEARTKCGQSADLSFDAVRDALKKQVRTIKSTYQCESVKFRVVVEDGKAKLKAVPQGGG
jgi:hypothetical protein